METRRPVVAIAMAEFDPDNVTAIGGQRLYGPPRIQLVELIFDQARMTDLTSGECLNIELGRIPVSGQNQTVQSIHIDDAKIMKWSLPGEMDYGSKARLVDAETGTPSVRYVLSGYYVQKTNEDQAPTTKWQPGDFITQKIKVLNGWSAIEIVKTALWQFKKTASSKKAS